MGELAPSDVISQQDQINVMTEIVNKSHNRDSSMERIKIIKHPNIKVTSRSIFKQEKDKMP